MQPYKINRNWHWIFWTIYFLVNHIIFSPEFFGWRNICIQLIFLAHNAGAAYVTLDWWVPKLYRKGQYGRFLLATTLTILVFGVALMFSLMGFYGLLMEEAFFTFQEFFDTFIGPVFWSNFSGITAVTVPHFVFQRIEMDRRTKRLEKEKLEAELKVLKSQLHPHFLFNALNNIYFLIKKDPETAADALAGFSNLLRFQLYEANNETVSLKKEIDYLKQFADIARLRKGENFDVRWQVESTIEQVQIAPLLLMPLLENAFKHGSNKNGFVEIILLVTNDQKLHFKISNTVSEDTHEMLKGFEAGGIGLANIRKRLELLYPQRHELTMREEEDIFSVQLDLELEMDES
ncbi:MAG: histidine kinase [Bacteroidota bacterium]